MLVCGFCLYFWMYVFAVVLFFFFLVLFFKSPIQSNAIRLNLVVNANLIDAQGKLTHTLNDLECPWKITYACPCVQQLTALCKLQCTLLKVASQADAAFPVFWSPVQQIPHQRTAACKNKLNEWIHEYCKGRDKIFTLRSSACLP